MTPRLFLVCGMPGAGKTTLATELADRHDAVRLCPDDWMTALDLDVHDAPRRRSLEKLLWAQGLALLAAGTSVVVEFGSWSRLDREHKRRDATDVGAAVELHVLDVPLEVRWRRIRGRNASSGPEISREQLVAYEHFWQPVTPEERAAYDAPLASEE